MIQLDILDSRHVLDYVRVQCTFLEWIHGCYFIPSITTKMYHDLRQHY